MADTGLSGPFLYGFCLGSFLLVPEGTDAHPFTDRPINSQPHGNLPGSCCLVMYHPSQGPLTTEC